MPDSPTLIPCDCFFPTFGIRAYLPFLSTTCVVLFAVFRTYEAHLSSLFPASRTPDTWSWRRWGFVKVAGTDLCSTTLSKPSETTATGLDVLVVSSRSRSTIHSAVVRDWKGDVPTNQDDLRSPHAPSQRIGFEARNIYRRG